MSKAVIHLVARAAFALALAAPSLTFAQSNGEPSDGSVQTLGDNLRIQRGINRAAFEILANTAVAVESDDAFSEISIANPEIADIYMLTNKSIYVLGKKPGRTTLMLLGSGGGVTTVLDIVVTPDISEFEQRLAQLLPDQAIEAFTANDGIVLTGPISSVEDMDKALELASRYAPGRISNLMTLASGDTGIDVAEIEARLGEILVGEAIKVRAVNDGIVLTGAVSTRAQIERALVLAEQFMPGRVSNLMTSNEVPTVLDEVVLAAKLQEILPDEGIELHAVGNNIVLSGTASSDIRVAQAIELMRVFAPDSNVTNLVSVPEVAGCTVRTRRGGEIIEMPVPCSG